MTKISVDKAFLKARSHLRKGEIEEARLLYQGVLKTFPNNKRAKLEIAQLSQNNITTDQSPPEGVINHLTALYQKGQLAEVVEQTSQLTQEFPHAFMVWNILGGVASEMGKTTLAESALRQAIAIDSNIFIAHYNLANVLSSQGKLDEAIEAYRQAIYLKPDYAQAYYNMANALKDQSKLDQAITAYKEALTLKPDYAAAYNNMANAFRKQGKDDEAIASYRQVISLKPNSPSVTHLLAALTGETTNSAPRAYVEKIFDEYASNFDRALVDDLEYKIPKVITEMILKKHLGDTLGSILDLGCGTGLTGLEIKEHCTKLEGIDLSNAMLEKARNRNIYDKLTHSDILDYLSTEDLNFDYFISTDVFIYIGDLSDVFRLIKARNRSGGKLVFSTEDTHKEGFFLEKSGRYSHSRAYIESLCNKFNYKLSYFETANLRKDKDLFITGCLYLLDF